MKTKKNEITKGVVLATSLLFATATLAGVGEDIKTQFNGSASPSKLVASGWVKNHGGKGFKIIQVQVKDTGSVYNLHINSNGKMTKTNENKSEKLNLDYDYKMISTKAGWAEMGTGANGPMYHMTPFVGALSFDGPYAEAISNMGPFENFLKTIGKNVR